MPSLLIYGAPDASPDLFHAIPDEIIDPYELGADEILASGVSRHQFEVEIALRACRELGVGSAIVPPEFPLGVADHLRAAGIDLTVAPEAFVERRRAKSGAQLEGIRRAQAAADAAMGVGARMIRELRTGLTSEEVREAMQAACDELDC